VCNTWRDILLVNDVCHCRHIMHAEICTCIILIIIARFLDNVSRVMLSYLQLCSFKVLQCIERDTINIKHVWVHAVYAGNVSNISLAMHAE